MSTLAASERERPPLAAAALEAVELSKQFGGVHALRGVSLRLREGAIVGLIGPNGSGKTTLLNCVSGVFGPTSGSVLLDGAEITGKPAHEIARAGVVRTFQNVRLFDGLTTLENVAVAALAAGGTRRLAPLPAPRRAGRGHERARIGRAAGLDRARPARAGLRGARRRARPAPDHAPLRLRPGSERGRRDQRRHACPG